MTHPKIAVMGSLNVDITLNVESLPHAGETVRAISSLVQFGGKGANQAVAAARAGGSVKMLGCVGNDDHGRDYLEHLKGEEVDASAVCFAGNAIGTGKAVILVDRTGENVIVVESGANGEVKEHTVENWSDEIASADVLLLQFECPIPAVRRIAQLAAQSGVTVMVNPSPWRDEIREPDFPCDYLIVNASEAGRLLQVEKFTGAECISVGALSKRGLQALVITSGAGPTIYLSADGRSGEVKPPGVQPIDTVGAGDSFTGAFAVAISEGRSLEESVRFGNAAGALATLKRGAQTAIPVREEILRLEENGGIRQRS